MGVNVDSRTETRRNVSDYSSREDGKKESEDLAGGEEGAAFFETGWMEEGRGGKEQPKREKELQVMKNGE